MKKFTALLMFVGLTASAMAVAQDHKDTKTSQAHHTRSTATDSKTMEARTVEKEEKTGIQRPDAWVMAKVKSTFAVTSGVDATDISVSVTNGQVFLSGTVGSTTELNEAKRVAQGIEGVKSVDTSKIVVQPDSAASRK